LAAGRTAPCHDAPVTGGLTHAEWLREVPARLQEAAARWRLRLGRPYPRGAAGYAIRAEREDGTQAALKLVYPHPEAEHEAEALTRWDGKGAVRLLERDDAGWAMLLERCEPGAPLSRAGGRVALDVLTGLLPRLWVPAGPPFRSLAEEAAEWRAGLADTWERAGRPYDRRLLDVALEALADLPGSQGEQVLLHQDLHGENVLAARREPWLAIDPKPLAGEREFAVAPIVRSVELGHGRRQVLGRLDRLCAELGLDRDRARGWTIAQTLAWAFDGLRPVPTHLETAAWLAAAPPVRRSRPPR
jgi:streptomycin 6-kinase